MDEAFIEGAHEHEGGERSTKRKLAIRLRHNFTLGPGTSLALSALTCYAAQGNEKYLYSNPATTAPGRIELIKDHDLLKLRPGPSFELSENAELEFRCTRSWNMHTGAHVSDAYIVEGTWRF